MADMRAKGRGVPPPVVQGEKNKRAKLSESQARQIKERHRDTLTSLAEEFGVSISAIHAVRSGRNWAHLK